MMFIKIICLRIPTHGKRKKCLRGDKNATCSNLTTILANISRAINATGMTLASVESLKPGLSRHVRFISVGSRICFVVIGVASDPPALSRLAAMNQSHNAEQYF